MLPYIKSLINNTFLKGDKTIPITAFFCYGVRKCVNSCIDFLFLLFMPLPCCAASQMQLHQLLLTPKLLSECFFLYI